MVFDIRDAGSGGKVAKGVCLVVQAAIQSAHGLPDSQHVDQFVYKIPEAESDRLKRKRLHDLKLEPEEWETVQRFLDLLTVCRTTALA
jgi:hypothetical protein